MKSEDPRPRLNGVQAWCVSRIVALTERASPGPCGGAVVQSSQIARHDRFSARLWRLGKRVPFWGPFTACLTPHGFVTQISAVVPEDRIESRSRTSGVPARQVPAYPNFGKVPPNSRRSPGDASYSLMARRYRQSERRNCRDDEVGAGLRVGHNSSGETGSAAKSRLPSSLIFKSA